MLLLKRTVVIFVAATILIVVAALIYKEFTPAPAPAPKPTHRTVPAKAKPWNGALSRVYDTTFVRQSDQIQLQSVGFTGLNTAATEVTINMVVTPGALKKPAWLNQKAFSIRSAATARYYSVGTTITQNGASYDVTVVAHRLPTAGLSDPGTSGTCPIAFVPAGALGLFIFGPDGTFVIQLVPPAPPAGQCFDYAPVKLPAACARATSTLAVLQQSDLVRVRAVERAHGSARTRLSAAYRTALKREQSARSHATATARSAACNSGPSAGNPL